MLARISIVAAALGLLSAVGGGSSAGPKIDKPPAFEYLGASAIMHDNSTASYSFQWFGSAATLKVCLVHYTQTSTPNLTRQGCEIFAQQQRNLGAASSPVHVGHEREHLG
jgi:cytochrome oxidase assembly protein ShyY1